MKKALWLLLLTVSWLFGALSLQKAGVYGGGINSMKIAGNFLYTAGKDGIGVISLSDSANLREISFTPTKSEVLSLFVDDFSGKLYAGLKDGSLKVYSLLNPTSLTKITEYKEDGCEINDIKEQDGYLYLACAKKGLVVLDISNSNYFFKVGSLKVPGEAKKIILRGNIAFLLSKGFGVNVINISNPSKLSFERKFNITPNPIDMALKGKFLYITNSNHGLLVMDVENPKTLDWDKQEKFISTKTYFSKIKIVGNTLFVLEGGALKAMSILEPLNPLSLFSYKTLSKIDDFVISKDKIYLNVEAAGIESLDISDIQKPKYISRYLGKNFYANTFFARGKYAYVADKYFGIHIIDISKPNDIRFVSFLDTNGTVSDIFLKGKYAFIGIKSGSVLIADILNPYKYKIISTINLSSPIESVYVKGDFLYIAKGGDGFDIFDISDLKKPLKIGDFFTGGYVYDIKTKGRYAFVSNYDKGRIDIVDISYPNLPFLQGSVFIGRKVYKIDILDSFLYVGCDRYFKIFDISNIKSPILKASYMVGGGVVSFDIKGDYALLGIKDRGLKIINFRDFTNIYLESFIENSHLTKKVSFDYDEAIGSFGEDGLLIYKIFMHSIKPKEVYAFAIGMDRAYVFWDRVKEKISGYYVTRVQVDTKKRVVVAMLDRYSEDFEDFGLLPNTRYYYEVQVSTDFGLQDATLSNVIQTEGGNPPASVSDLRVILKDNSAILTWKDNSDNENAFYVTRHTESESKVVAILPKDSTSFVDDKLKSGEKYWYEVTAVNEFGKSAPVFSEKIEITQLKPPIAPSDFRAEIQNGSSVLLKWKDNSDNEEAFVITRKNPDGSFEKIATLAPDTTSYVDKNLSDGVYQYDIAAMNSAGFSKRVLSNSIEIKKESDTNIPKAPSDFVAKVIDNKHVKLSWRDNSDNENGFYILRKDSEGMVTVIAFVDKDVTQYIDDSVKAGESYIYQIVAMNDNGISKWVTSNKIQIEGSSSPKAPSLIRAEAKGKDVKITWQDNSDNEIGFYLERAKKGENPIVIAILDPNTSEFVDKGLKEGNYTYYISAFNDFGVSIKSKSNEVEIK